MAKRRVSFLATKVKKIPIRVKFRTSDGKTISFRATKAVKIPKKVRFYARRKRK